jgi:cell division protein FtsI/penicillin-binding protein 2
MIAFAPASHPVIAVAVMVPGARLDQFGATVAGPIVKAMIETALNGR